MTMTGSSAGCISVKAFLPVSELAVKMVNNRTDVLPGYRLRLVWSDTKVFIIICILVTLSCL